jgi:Protein of unknown function (DUF2971)
MLFKYCSFDRAMVILKSQRIRLTQPSDFNDPFELHPEFQLMSQEDIAELPPALDEQGNAIEGMRQLTPEAMNRMMAAVSPHLSRMASIHQQHPEATFFIDNNAVGRDYYDQNFGILSLTETPDNLLMWAHYGDCHKGVVLGFDETHPFFRGAEIVAGLARLNKVEYNQKRPVLSITTRNNPKVFLRKSIEWAYESEWRLIRPLSEAADRISREHLIPTCLFDIPQDAIKKIITGSQMIQVQYQELCNYCVTTQALAHIRIHHALLSKEHYELEVHPALTEEEQIKRSQGKVTSAKPFDV